jgi:hypothetical protein
LDEEVGSDASVESENTAAIDRQFSVVDDAEAGAVSRFHPSKGREQRQLTWYRVA